MLVQIMRAQFHGEGGKITWIRANLEVGEEFRALAALVCGLSSRKGEPLKSCPKRHCNVHGKIGNMYYVQYIYYIQYILYYINTHIHK